MQCVVLPKVLGEGPSGAKTGQNAPEGARKLTFGNSVVAARGRGEKRVAVSREGKMKGKMKKVWNLCKRLDFFTYLCSGHFVTITDEIS